MFARRSLLLCSCTFVILSGCSSFLGDGADEGETGGDGDGSGAADTDTDGQFNAHCEPQADWDPAWEAYEAEVLELVNSNRAAGATCGSDQYAATGPMVADEELRCAARLHSQDMAIRMFFDHTNPDNMSPWDRVDLTDYTGFASGENIAQGYQDPAAVMDGWMNSPGHCTNIMNPGNNELGVGFYGDGNYWTQVMGNR